MTTELKPKVIILSDESTWPQSLLDCLDKHNDIIYQREAIHAGIKKGHFSAKQYDKAHDELHEALLPFHLKGYHCTKLIESEISSIICDGMKLQNLISLTSRIDNLLKQGLISLDIANELKSKNEADDKNRAAMLWFCFFLPKIAGERGIERFFRSWGGEALYNSHESNPKTGIILKELGTPCIIEADVPISSLNRYSLLVINISRVFLKNRGLKTNENCNLAAYSTKNIAPENIKKVIQLSDLEFIELSDYKNWDQALSD